MNRRYLLLTLCWLSACSTHAPRPITDEPIQQGSQDTVLPAQATQSHPLNKSLRDPINVYMNLMAHYKEWRGVRYKLGGESKKGVDCSAFVQIAFRERFGVALPRTTAKQAFSGRHVDKRQLIVGDLIFFKINRRVGHVGIYLGERKFLHASASKGVMISDLGQRYWSQRYWKAVRM